MDTELLYELVEWVKEISPELWKIAVRQVYIMAFGNVLWIIASVIFGILLRRFVDFCGVQIPIEREKKLNGDEIGWQLGRVFSWVGIGICIAAALSSLYMIVASLLNVEYWAIKVLLDLIPMPN